MITCRCKPARIVGAKINLLKLLSLMGHADILIVHVYGNYVKGLEKDREKILAYFNRDFVAAELRKAA